MRLSTLAAAAAALLAGGCFGGADAPERLYTLTASASAPTAARSGAPGEALTVLAPVVPESLQVRRVPVYVSPTAVQYLTDAQWVDDPAELFRTVLSETLAARTSRVVVDPSVYTRDPAVQVTGNLSMFGFDPNRMEAVAVYDAAVARGGGIATRRFESRIPVGSPDALAVIPALNEATNRIAAEVAAWVVQ